MASKKRSYNEPSINLYNHQANIVYREEIEMRLWKASGGKLLVLEPHRSSGGNDDIPYR
jgi:hypothetical protein